MDITLLKIKRNFHKLVKTKLAYSNALDELKDSLAGKVGFEFYITDSGSDGLLLGNETTSNVALLTQSLNKVINKGFITEEEHESICI